MGIINDSYGAVCRTCISTGAVKRNDCVTCLLPDLRAVSEYRCPRCSVPTERGQLCDQCVHASLLKEPRFKNGLTAISYNRKHTDFSFALHAYKGSKIPERPWMVTPLRYLLETYLNRHMSCIQHKFGPIEAIIPIPGNAEKILDKQSYLGIPVCRCLDDHRTGPGFSHGGIREYDPNRFTINLKPFNFQSIILFDDVYTKGVTSLSAACALNRAGVSTIIPVVIARQILSSHEETVESNSFDIGRCCNC